MGRPVVCRLFTTKPQTCRLLFFYIKFAVRLLTADSSLLQPTEGANTTPSHVEFPQCCALIHMHNISSSLSPHSVTCHPIFMGHAQCVFLRLPRHLHSLLLLPHLLSDHPLLLSARQLHLPRCGGQIPCAIPPRTLAPWPRTSLPQVMRPTTTSS